MQANPKGPLIPVLFVNTPTQPPIGADTWILVQVIRILDRSRFDVHVACAEGSKEQPTPMFSAVQSIPDVTLLRVDFGREHTGATKLRRLVETIADLRSIVSFVRLAVHMRRRRIPIIYTVSRPRDALACVLIARITRRKSLINMQLAFGDWMSRSLKWSLRHADGLVSISDFVTTTLIDNGVAPDRIHKAYNAVNLEEWNAVSDKSAVRAELGLPTDGPMVVNVSRLYESKGTAELLEALARVRDEIPDVKLVIVGRDVTGGPYMSKLDAIIARESLEANVIFAGQRSDVPLFMAAADIFAMPSVGEPFGIVFAEAQAIELPVVALNDGGTPEVVEHGRAGLLSDPGDVQAIASNLLTLLRDPELRRQMGANGREDVSAKFTAEHLANAMAGILERVGR